MFNPICKRAKVQGLKESRLTIRGGNDGTLMHLRMFGQGPSCSPRIISQSAMPKVRYVHGCRMAKYKT